ncbi:hypothetical protein JTB14_024621 [Gonioctena quinquepunctata]|nr:hypothetical protein JTB14_024621 [Gonioctena quinquepunctata]
MKSTQFIEQVQSLMEIQRSKQMENVSEKSNYTWLCSRKINFAWISMKQELQIRQTLDKVSSGQRVEIMKKLINWLDENPNTDVQKIPEITLFLLHDSYTLNLITQMNFVRMESFRSSLRRLSNKISPISLNVENRPRVSRSVTFHDIPLIYKIS